MGSPLNAPKRQLYLLEWSDRRYSHHAFPSRFLLPIISDKFKNIALTTLTGAAFSILIEFTQYYTGRGLFESDDIIHNTIGAFVGCICYLLIIDRFLVRESESSEFDFNE